MVVVVLVTLFGFMALSVDVGYLYVIKGELQNAADAAAMAATGKLSVRPLPQWSCTTAHCPNMR